MRFRIRFAEQIVGVFIILALAALIFVIIMMGRAQRWFTRDTTFYTESPSASGISNNMPILYRGFTIGNVKSFNLNENDRVRVVFSVHSEYRDRVKNGSMVEIVVSPIGLGNQFVFHPGKGTDLIPDSGFVPNVDSRLAQELINQGLADDLNRDDSISLLLNRVNSLVGVLDESLRDASDATSLGQIIGGVNNMVAGAENLPDTINNALETLVSDIDALAASIDEALASLDPILADFNVFSADLADPEGTVSKILDSEGEIYVSLVDSLQSLSGILDSLDETIAFIPRQLPQLAALIMDLQEAMKSANDVLVALTNNPLLRGGVPTRVDVQAVGTSPRDIRF